MKHLFLFFLLSISFLCTTYAQSGFYTFLEGSRSTFDYEPYNFNGAVGVSYILADHLEVGIRSNVSEAVRKNDQESRQGFSEVKNNIYDLRIADFWNIRVPLLEQYFQLNIRMENFAILPDHWQVGGGFSCRLNRVELAGVIMKKLYLQQSNYEARLSVRINIIQPK